ncbi:MAG: D-fructose 1,6-bisphosphatase [Candidatus Thermoplasmatota archaeon]|nr:D-fructose 1,6-bisphosphatase [Candidatus Thermoplasmatota archaeon]
MESIALLKKLCIDVADAISAVVHQEQENCFDRFGTEVCMGADGTPTQHIDKVAEDVALEVIDGRVNVLSEEAGYVDNGREYTMVLDPIDGTRNAVNGVPFYCTSIAIGRRRLSDIVFGLVRNLPTGDTYTAEKDNGAACNGRPISVRQREEPLFSLVLGTSGAEETWQRVRHHHIRALGAAALEMSLVAAGALDAYYQANEYLRVTDFAAGTLLVRAAGGAVYDSHGDMLDVPLDLDVRSSVLAVSGPGVREVLI